MNLFKSLAIVLTFFLAACGDPIDSKLVTDKGVEAYHASLAEFAEKGDPEAIKAYNYFANKMTIEGINSEKTIETPRDLIVQASELLLKELTPEERKRIELIQENYKKLQEGLYVRDVTFEIEDEFFGPMPYINATYVNQSGLSLSESQWVAELYIDGNTEPSARYAYTTNFGDGFDSGYTMKGKRLMGQVKGDPNWITPAIRRAKSRIVKVSPYLGSQKGLDLKYLTGTEEQIADLSTREANAKKWLEMFK